jgi:hypothetical protein
MNESCDRQGCQQQPRSTDEKRQLKDGCEVTVCMAHQSYFVSESYQPGVYFHRCSLAAAS